MKVLLANSFFYPRGGDCVHALWLLSRLKSRGHEVVPLSMHHPLNLESPFSSHWLRNVDYRGNYGPCKRLRLGLRSVYAPEARRLVRSLIRDTAPNVAHFHTVHHHLTMAAVVACYDEGLPVVWTLHDYRTVCPATALLRRGYPCEACRGGRYWKCALYRCKSGELSRSLAATLESYVSRYLKWLRRVDCFVAPSNFLAMTVRRMGLEGRIEVIPNPLDADGVVTGRPGIRERQRLLYVGRLSEEKGVLTLLTAVAALDGLHLTIVGDGPLRAVVERVVGRLGLVGRVTVTGWLDASQVRRAMECAAALCVPSLWYENCPLVVLEAMAAGCPIIASDLGGLTELLDYGRAGWLVSPSDASAWAETIHYVLDHPDEARVKAEYAYERVRERHDPEKFIARIEDIYRSVIEARS